MKKFKHAIIGMGVISRNHLIAVKANSQDIELVAVCDTIPENIEKSLNNAGLTGNIARYTDYKVMLSEQKPDIVTIATPSWLHGMMAQDCLENNCNVIVEKPMALNLKEMDAMISKAKEKGLLLITCHQNRYNNSITTIKKALDSDRFGHISHMTAHVRWNRNKNYYDQAGWRGKWKSDGGCLMNQCIHDLDLLCWMLGDIDEVFAYTARQQHPYIEGEDLGLALIKAKSGAYGLFEGTVNIYPKNLEETLNIFGEKGTVQVGGESLNRIHEWIFADGLDNPELIKKAVDEVPTNSTGLGHTKLYADVIRSLRTGAPDILDGDEGKKVVELILAMYKSKKTGRAVKLPLNNFEITEMEGTF